MADARRWMLASGWLAVAASGCGPIELPVAIDLVLPADSADLTRTDNVSITLEPLGSTNTFNADGLDFTLSLELEPLDERQTISVFLAEGDALLAWGRTPPLSLAGSNDGVGLLLARPDALSGFDYAFDTPDPQELAASVGDIGMLVVASDGTAAFLDVLGWQVGAAAPIPSDDVPAPDDGVLVPDPDGNVQRIATAEGLVALVWSPIDDAWTRREVDDAGAALFGARPDATIVQLGGGRTLRVVGGGDRLDAVDLELTDDATVAMSAAPIPALDEPRPGATALLVDRGEGELTDPVLFGSASDVPVAWHLTRGIAWGPAGPWVDAACIQLDAPAVDGPIRVLCGGGLRDDQPTPDAVVLGVPAPGDPSAPTIDEHPGLMGEPMADPLLLPGASAVYAQGDARSLFIGRDDLAVAPDATSPLRAEGGHTATLLLGVTFVVGGVDRQGAPLPRWSYFAPQPG